MNDNKRITKHNTYTTIVPAKIITILKANSKTPITNAYVLVPLTNKSAKSGNWLTAKPTIISLSDWKLPGMLSILTICLVANSGSVASKILDTFPKNSHTNASKTTKTTVNFISLFKPARKPIKADNAKIPNTASENINIKSLTFGIFTPLS